MNEGVDWVGTLVGLSVMIAFCVVVWSLQLLVDAMKRREAEDAGEGPGATGS